MTRLFALLFAMLIGCFGVEQYREGLPSTDLAIRFVADDAHPAEQTLTRIGTDETLGIVTGTVVDASQIEHVRLLDAAEGNRVIVIVLRDAGRDRLREATTNATGRRLAIVAGGHVIAAPTIRGPLTEGEAYVSVPVAHLQSAFASMTAH